MLKKWKKKLSALLVVTLIAALLIPQLSVIADTADVIVGSNGTIYDADYVPDIYDEDDWDDDDDDDVEVLYDDATPSDATPSNASPSNASGSNWRLASGSNAINIVEFTDPGPLLPATGGVMKKRMLRAVAYNASNASSESEPEGIYTNKTATKNEDGSYTIQLESFVEGNIKKETVTTPVDIVLVLDVSGSMDDCIVCGDEVGDGDGDVHEYIEVGKAGDVTGTSGITYYYYYKNGNSQGGRYTEVYYCNGTAVGHLTHAPGWYSSSNHINRNKLSNDTLIYIKVDPEECTKRMDALQSAVKLFIDSVADNAVENTIDHRIAVVKFASGKRDSDYALQNGNITIGDDMDNSGYNYTQVVKALTDVSSDDNAEELKKAVDDLEPSGATQADYGMEYAEYLIKGISAERKSQKVVIMFTDGSPTSYREFDSDVANGAISASKNIKDDSIGATVYTIGVFAGADYSPVTSGTSNENKYMHYVSSNFKDAQNMSTPGTSSYPSDGSSYYLSTGSSDGLNDIFDNISQQIQGGGASIEMGEETVVNDVVTPYFDIPKDTSSIKVYTSDCTGKASSGEYIFKDEKVLNSNAEVSIDSETNSLSVTGFDYSANFVSENGRTEGDVTQSGQFYGRKLIIEFTVTPRDGFLGGNNVPTNVSATISSTADGNLISKTFEDDPRVNVPIPAITVTAQDKNVYLTGSLTEKQLVDGAVAVAATGVPGTEISFDSKETNYGLEEWQNEFVDIQTSASTDKNNLTEDGTYDVFVTIIPEENAMSSSSGKAATAQTGTARGNINVFLPTVTYKDGEVYYGDSIPSDDYLDTLRLGGITWKHGDSISTGEGVEMLGEEPIDIKFTYQATSDSSLVNSDNKVVSKSDIPISITDVTINGISELKSKTTLERSKCNDKESDLADNQHFVLHVKTCTLNIKKEGGDQEEAYLFHVVSTDAANPVDTWIRITGNHSKVIKELPVGTYTVTEDEKWSWRYKSLMDPSFVSLKKENPEDTITCTNTKENNKWLNAFSVVWKNTFGISYGTEVNGNENE